MGTKSLPQPIQARVSDLLGDSSWSCGNASLRACECVTMPIYYCSADFNPLTSFFPTNRTAFPSSIRTLTTGVLSCGELYSTVALCPPGRSTIAPFCGTSVPASALRCGRKCSGVFGASAAAMPAVLCSANSGCGKIYIAAFRLCLVAFWDESCRQINLRGCCSSYGHARARNSNWRWSRVC
jgi:hypothetical protein